MFRLSPLPSRIGALRRAIGTAWDRPAWRRVGWLAGLVLLPFVVWLMGSGLVWVAPKSYRSEALIQVSVGAAELSGEVEKMRSSKVVEVASRLVAEPEAGKHPMSQYMLWASVSASEWRGPNLIRVEARGRNPEEAQRLVKALVDAYGITSEQEGVVRREPNLVYVEPVGAEQPRVADGMRMALGLGAASLVGLLLAIPLLKQVEAWAPVRRVPGLATATAS